MTDVQRLRGLRAMIGDAVEHGASAIERVHLATARRPFVVLEHLPGMAEPVKDIHAAHDTVVSGVYTSIRLVNRAVGKTFDAMFTAFDADKSQSREAEPETEAGTGTGTGTFTGEKAAGRNGS